MRTFLDTNLLIDVLEQRLPHCINSQAVLDRCDALSSEVFVAWHGVATAYYIHSRTVGAALAQQAIAELLQVVQVSYVGDVEMRKALALQWKDLEDAMQCAAAEACGADVLVTRNAKDFAGSSMPVMSPDEFVVAYPL